MSKANLFNRDIRANKSPRNAYDMSYSTLFSSPCGLIQPAYVQEVKKGDLLKVGLSNVSRTRPVMTSAFMSFDEKIDFWYVPNYLLWSPYDEWRLKQSYPHSSLALQQANQQNLCPYTSYSSLVSHLSSFYSLPASASGIVSRGGYYYNNLNAALRYLDLLGYGVTNQVNWSNMKGSTLTTGSDYPVVEKILNTFTSFSTAGIPLNYFRLAAFQCIYMHHYRNEEFEKLDPTCYNMDSLFADGKADNNAPGTSQTNSSPQYLVSVNSSTPPSNISTYLIDWSRLLQPRYKNWKKDIFTSAKPNSGFQSSMGLGQLSPLYGTDFYWPTSASVHIGNTNPVSNTTTGNFVGVGSSEETIFSHVSQNGSIPFINLSGYVSPSDSSQVYTSLYPQQIYNLMAQDKFLRSAVYADKNLSDQMKAIFGDDYNDCHCPSYLGSFSTSINISDVTATSAGNDGDTESLGTSLLGEIAGKGYNVSGKNSIFKRKFDYDGIVIGMHYIIPRNNYDSCRINLFNTKVSSFDYFYPQFDGLGMQPIFMFERNFDGSSSAAPPTTLFGYGPRYHEYKQRTNEIHGPFQRNQTDSDWTLSNNAVNISDASNFNNFKVLPTITDRIFAMNWDSSLASDPFLCYFYFDSTLVSDMEVYGTPSV